MSFRIEEKVIVTSVELLGIKEKLTQAGMSELFPSRVIRSVYFDSRSNGMFVDSEEGVLPRKKIRIRTYDGSTAAGQLETKISSVEGRFKTSKKLSDRDRKTFLRNGIVDARYGVCRAKVEVAYTRAYFELSGVRITFDTDIRYQKYQTSLQAPDNMNVLEIKAPKEAPSDFLERLITEPRRRFSKFSRACLLTKAA